MKLKKVISVFVCLMVLLNCFPVFADSELDNMAEIDIAIQVGGYYFDIQRPGYESGGTYYLPVREVCERLKMEVIWNKTKKTITVNRSDFENPYVYTLGDNGLYIKNDTAWIDFSKIPKFSMRYEIGNPTVFFFVAPPVIVVIPSPSPTPEPTPSPTPTPTPAPSPAPSESPSPTPPGPIIGGDTNNQGGNEQGSNQQGGDNQGGNSSESGTGGQGGNHGGNQGNQGQAGNQDGSSSNNGGNQGGGSSQNGTGGQGGSSIGGGGNQGGNSTNGGGSSSGGSSSEGNQGGGQGGNGGNQQGGNGDSSNGTSGGQGGGNQGGGSTNGGSSSGGNQGGQGGTTEQPTSSPAPSPTPAPTAKPTPSPSNNPTETKQPDKINPSPSDNPSSNGGSTTLNNEFDVKMSGAGDYKKPGDYKISIGILENKEQEEITQDVLSKYKTVISIILGCGTLTMLLFFVLNFAKLGKSSGNPQMRQSAMIGIIFTGIGTLLLAGVMTFFTFFYNFLG